MAIITAANLKSQLGIPDSDDDVTIGYVVNAANQAVVEYCLGSGRDFATTAIGSPTARVFHPCSAYVCDVDDFWETTVLVVKTDEDDNGTYETTWTIATDFTVDPPNNAAYGRPYTRILATGTRTFPASSSRRYEVQITAAWGWAAVPSAVFEATLIHAARLFKRRNSPEGVLGGFADFGAVRVPTRMDPDVRDLLAPFRHPDLVAMVA